MEILEMFHFILMLMVFFSCLTKGRRVYFNPLIILKMNESCNSFTDSTKSSCAIPRYKVTRPKLNRVIPEIFQTFNSYVEQVI